MSKLRKTVRRVIAYLEANEIDYAMVGALAVAPYGEPTYTLDVDFVIAIPADKLGAFFDILEEAFVHTYSDLSDLTDRVSLETIFRPTGVRVDFILRPFGRTLDGEFWRRRRKQVTETFGVIWLASPEDIVVFETASRKPKHFGHAESVLLKQGKKLYLDYLKKRAKEYGVLPEVNEMCKRLGVVKEDLVL